MLNLSQTSSATFQRIEVVTILYVFALYITRGVGKKTFSYSTLLNVSYILVEEDPTQKGIENLIDEDKLEHENIVKKWEKYQVLHKLCSL